MASHDLESSTPLLHHEQTLLSKTLTTIFSIIVGVALLMCLAIVIQTQINVSREPTTTINEPYQGQTEGAYNKSSASLTSEVEYSWSNDMLQWQRTGFHFQPEKNWMGDPNGPLFYKGWYHFFFQYNPGGARWGNISWGHTVSRDLIHWLLLPVVLGPDQWYDAAGALTGSITVVPDGRVVITYTGLTSENRQLQNVAFPEDVEDPLLLKWVKSDANPVIRTPPRIISDDFRDPTTAWYDNAEGAWKLAIGSKDEFHNSICFVYRTVDFINYEQLPGYLHSYPGTGVWECIDFYPVLTNSTIGLDTSVPAGPMVQHVLKASMSDDTHDYYSIGTYDLAAGTWMPNDVDADVGIGLRYDYGKFYASKTFYDPEKKRRVLWGFTGETDGGNTNLLKGWASVTPIPRTVVYDQKTGTHLLLWPVEEVESLRQNGQDFNNIEIGIGSVIPLDVARATELDIVAEFEIDGTILSRTVEADLGYNCSTSGGSVGRGVLGPFGFLVQADKDLYERTAVYFYVGRKTDGELQTFLCQDDLRSSAAEGLVKRVYGSTVPVLNGEMLTLRILVDHSIVESFAQGGRTVITSRSYPTKAINSAARVFLFNNATGATVTAKSVKIWQMDSADIRQYPFEA